MACFVFYLILISSIVTHASRRLSYRGSPGGCGLVDPPEVLYPAVDKGGIENLKEKCAQGSFGAGTLCRTPVFTLKGGEEDVVGGPDEVGGARKRRERERENLPQTNTHGGVGGGGRVCALLFLSAFPTTK